jgi:hypothetical protein
MYSGESELQGVAHILCAELQITFRHVHKIECLRVLIGSHSYTGGPVFETRPRDRSSSNETVRQSPAGKEVEAEGGVAIVKKRNLVRATGSFVWAAVGLQCVK